MAKKLLLIGFGGHAKSVIDTIEATDEYKIIGFSERKLDERLNYRGYKVICTDDQLTEVFAAGVEYAFITIGFMGHSNLRERLLEKLRSIGYKIPMIIDPTAIMAEDVQVGLGTFVGKRAVLNAGVIVGENTIINTGVILDHETVVGAHSHVACGSILCGRVHVGNSTLVGAGSTIIQNVNVGTSCIIGAGSTVLHDMADNTKGYGVI